MTTTPYEGGRRSPQCAGTHALRPVAPHGFSLIEIMIVLAMVAILAVIAMPSYQHYQQRSHRAQARAGLLQAAHWMERVATANGVYPEATPGRSPLPTTLSAAAGPRYLVSLATSTQAAYTLRAVPLGDQSSDRCATLTLDHSGVHGVMVGGTAGSSSLVAECWSR